VIEQDKIAEQVRMCAACPKMCRHVCPTFFAWRSDAPTPHGRALLLHQDIIGLRNIDERGIEVLYQCLECSHCLTWCKPEIDIASLVENKRCDLVKSGRQPLGVSRLASRVKKTHNPFGETHSERNGWIETGKANGPKLIYFSGCTAAYREKGIAQDTVSILEYLGYSVTITPDEWCCGSPSFRTGDMRTGLEDASHNVEVLNNISAEEIIVTCPGCYRALTRDYPENGFELNKSVRHISELLNSLVDKLPLGNSNDSVTFHDPCHLGRHSGVYDAPRTVIERISGNPVVEMERNRENAMCCGNGAGLRTLFPEHAKMIGTERIRQALNVNANSIVTSCPFCKEMLESQSEKKIVVFDLPEFVMRAIESRNVKTD
jgi:heterodisulfide reductase subunit D